MIERAILSKLEEMRKHFSVIMLTGARQVGKTTLLQELRNKHSHINYVTLDYPNIRDLARKDPQGFLEWYGRPLIIDEIQYAPELLPYIKIAVDQKRENGMYYLTGSQMFHAMKNVSESLAGRVGVINTYSLSYNEINKRENNKFLPNVKLNYKSQSNIANAFNNIIKGGMPKLYDDINLSIEDFFGSYMQTYIERDIRDLINIKNERMFLKFMAIIATRTAQELNFSDIAKDIGIDYKTVQHWLSLLVTSGIVVLVQPYFANIGKRIIKRPKVYFMDTGLCSFLSSWNNPKALEMSAMSGSMFETYVVSEIIKNYANAGIDYKNRMLYYRDNHGKEIDLLIIENGIIHPIEIKKSSNPGKDDINNFSVLSSFDKEIGDGAIICTCPEIFPISKDVVALPYDAIGL